MTHTADAGFRQSAAPDGGPAGTPSLRPGGAPGFAPGDKPRLGREARPNAASSAAFLGGARLCWPAAGRRRLLAAVTALTRGGVVLASPGQARVGGAPG